MILKFILIGGILPGFICTITLLAAFLIARTFRRPSIPAFVFPLLVAISIIPAEMLVREGWPKLANWPKNAADRLLHITIVASLGGALIACVTSLVARAASRQAPGSNSIPRVDSDPRRSLILTLVLSIPLVAACLWMFLNYRVPSFWKTTSTGALWLALYTAAAVVIIASLELASRRRPKIDTMSLSPRDPAPIAILFIVANAIPPIAVKTGNAYVSQVCGGIVAALGAALLVSFLVPHFKLTRGGVTTLVGTLGAIGLAAFYFAEDPAPRLPMLLLAAAPIVASAALVLFLRAAGMWKRLVIASVIAAIPTLAAVAIVFAPAKKEPKPTSTYSYE